ncbi:hypothetical protein SISNIDRAFT_552702 [Sistotremastrum niveocremeum HHB9708]|uniref:Uncharacterized protein n=1 Tax=Sistotremastrum niveocremeum HHB9708 TaxID=1314777 RepID=A0A164P1B9_9AGAM|nr:hypothetical protein SISNIDRAFT_552702 [Sistotremastrum niveocremeum HHB9708]
MVIQGPLSRKPSKSRRHGLVVAGIGNRNVGTIFEPLHGSPGRKGAPIVEWTPSSSSCQSCAANSGKKTVCWVREGAAACRACTLKHRHCSFVETPSGSPTPSVPQKLVMECVELPPSPQRPNRFKDSPLDSVSLQRLCLVEKSGLTAYRCELLQIRTRLKACIVYYENLRLKAQASFDAFDTNQGPIIPDLLNPLIPVISKNIETVLAINQKVVRDINSLLQEKRRNLLRCQRLLKKIGCAAEE